MTEQTEEKHEFWKMESTGMLMKNSKKNENTIARDAKFWKENIWMEKGTEKVLAIPLVAYPSFFTLAHTGNFSMTRTAARLCFTEPLKEAGASTSLHPASASFLFPKLFSILIAEIHKVHHRHLNSFHCRC